MAISALGPRMGSTREGRGALFQRAAIFQVSGPKSLQFPKPHVWGLICEQQVLKVEMSSVELECFAPQGEMTGYKIPPDCGSLR